MKNKKIPEKSAILYLASVLYSHRKQERVIGPKETCMRICMMALLGMVGLGCSGSTTEVLAENWVLKEINSSPAVSKELTLGISKNGEVTGHLGCNTFSGRVKLSNNTIKFSEVITSTRACRPDILEAEREYSGFLFGANTWSKNSTGLKLQGSKTTLLFVPRSP